MAEREAVCVWSEDLHDVKYYFDDKDHSSEGKVYSVGNGAYNEVARLLGDGTHNWGDEIVRRVEFDKSFKDYDGLEYVNEIFSYHEALESVVGLENLNTSKVESMEGLFKNCESLKHIDLSNLDTGNVENMTNMFNGCKSLKSLDLSNFDTSKVENMSGMFAWSGFEKLDVSNFNTSRVENMEAMFAGCEKLKDIIGLERFDTSRVENMEAMFCVTNCFSRDNNPELWKDIKDWDTSKVLSMQGMFASADVEKLDLLGWDLSSVVDCEGMFNYSSISDLKINPNISSCGLDDKDVIKNPSLLINMERMFEGCKNLKELDLSNWDMFGVGNISRMFAGCENLENLNIEGWDLYNCAHRGGVLENCEKLNNWERLEEGIYKNTLNDRNFVKENLEKSVSKAERGSGKGAPVKVEER